MAFLSLNNWDVAVVNGAQMTPEEIGGGRERTVNGQMLIDRLGVARRWRFKTPPMTFEDAQALIGLVNGMGDTWSFEDPSGTASTNPQATITAAQSQTGKGYRTTQSTLNATSVIHTNVAADGAAVKWLVSAPATYRDAAKFTSSIYPCMTFENLLTSQQSSVDTDGAPPTGFEAIGAATLTGDETHYWESAGTGRSLKVVTSGASQGCRTAIPGLSPGAGTYTCSCYLKGNSGGESIEIGFVSDNPVDPTYIAGPTVTLVANTWIRVSFTSSAVPTGNIGMYLSNASGTPTFYVDGLQIEATDRLSNWKKGTGSNSSVALTYPLSMINKWDRGPFSVSAWVSGIYDASPGFQPWLVGALSGTRDLVYVGYQSASKIFFEVRDDDQVSVNITGGTAPTKAWNHVVATFDPKGNMIVYMNGSTATYGGSAAATTLTNLKWSGMSTFYIGGSTSGFDRLNAALDDLTIYPFAMPSTMVTAYYNKTYQTPAPPLMRAVSDIIPDSYIDVFGMVTNVTQIRAASSTNYQIVDFELYEPAPR